MNYWWVNQNQTFRHEVPGGYIWSPKRNKNGATNPFYEFMKAVAPGDAIFSFADTKIPAIGIAASHAYEAPKPAEFGSVGAYWDLIGWRVDVRFHRLSKVVRPVDHIDRLRPFLPPKYSPLQQNGTGLQSVYLTAVSEKLAVQIVDLIGSEARGILQSWKAMKPVGEDILIGQAEWEEHEVEVVKSSTLSVTEKLSLVLARQGQGLFRKRLSEVEHGCRITGVRSLEFLRASHAKPWRDSSNEERLDGENGLLLTPDVDLLFDRGLISFENSGKVLVSPVADRDAIGRMGITAEMLLNVGAFSQGQKKYLEYHRESIFLEAKVALSS